MWGVLRAYPVLKTMSAYAVLYPGANMVQQKWIIRNKLDDDHPQALDWAEAGRFCVYGAGCHAPLVYNAIQLLSRLFPGTALPQLLKKVPLLCMHLKD